MSWQVFKTQQNFLQTSELPEKHVFCLFVSECNEALIGDGFCDDKYNTMDCNFDGGDCCLENSDGDAVSSEEFCIDCICYDAPKVLSNCLVSEYVNNSVCEDFANVRECAFDGGKAYKKNQVHSILYIGQQEWQYKIMGLNSLGNDMKNI